MCKKMAPGCVCCRGTVVFSSGSSLWNIHNDTWWDPAGVPYELPAWATEFESDTADEIGVGYSLGNRIFGTHERMTPRRFRIWWAYNVPDGSGGFDQTDFYTWEYPARQMTHQFTLAWPQEITYFPHVPNTTDLVYVRGFRVEGAVIYGTGMSKTSAFASEVECRWRCNTDGSALDGTVAVEIDSAESRQWAYNQPRLPLGHLGTGNLGLGQLSPDIAPHAFLFSGLSTVEEPDSLVLSFNFASPDGTVCEQVSAYPYADVDVGDAGRLYGIERWSSANPYPSSGFPFPLGPFIERVRGVECSGTLGAAIAYSSDMGLVMLSPEDPFLAYVLDTHVGTLDTYFSINQRVSTRIYYEPQSRSYYIFHSKDRPGDGGLISCNAVWMWNKNTEHPVYIGHGFNVGMSPGLGVPVYPRIAFVAPPYE